MSATQRRFAEAFISGALSYPEVEAVYATARQRGDRREAPCPLCGPLRSDPAAQRPVFAMWNSFDGSIGYSCVRCGAKGRAVDRQVTREIAKDPARWAALQQVISQKAEDARLQDAIRDERLRATWIGSVEAEGTPAEAYLRFRGYQGRIPSTIRYVASPDGYRAPTLIAAAGPAVETTEGGMAIEPHDVTGLIRIFLRHDGRGKADMRSAKLSLGRINNNPVRLLPINDGLTLALCEGIEDTLSLAGPLGVGGWAVGGAGFFEAAATRIPAYVEAVILGEDENQAGHEGCNKAEKVIRSRTDWLAGRPPSVRRVRVWEGGAQ